jgi:EAL domain-containing protein (putative c-di-GMP-specific phosphodiesterase class I)
VVGALGASGLPASRLELEITETVLLQDDRAVRDVLHQMRELGAKISMDDFGTDYSSLSYLRSFPFDKIKIDRSFIRELGKEKSDCVAIITRHDAARPQPRHRHDRRGVETEEQLEILRIEDCTQLQGYLFIPPRPARDIPAILKKLQPQIRAA